MYSHVYTLQHDIKNYHLILDELILNFRFNDDFYCYVRECGLQSACDIL
jgi:hypothetical protein